MTNEQFNCKSLKTKSHIMKKFLVLLFFGFSIVAIAVGCGNKKASNSTTESHASMGTEYSSAYVCPMHCEGSGSDQAGTCPVCGMDYVLLEDHINDGHTH